MLNYLFFDSFCVAHVHLVAGAAGAAGAHIHDMTINFPAPILFKTDVYSAFTTEQITAITVFHSGGNNT